MRLLVAVEIVALLVFLWFCRLYIKYRNNYKLYMVFGKKGSGKTTLMVKLCLQYRKKGWHVYCDRHIPGATYFETDDFGKIGFPPNSLILIDEVGLVWDNRDFKKFPKEVKEFFKYQRQYRCVCYLFSQAFDIDKKIRDLTDHLYVVSNFMNVFSIARRVTKRLVVVHADKSAQGESKIVDDYNIDSLLLFFAGSIRVTFIPKYAKYFASYNPPELPELPDDYMEIPKFYVFKRSLPVLPEYQDPEPSDEYLMDETEGFSAPKGPRNFDDEIV